MMLSDLMRTSSTTLYWDEVLTFLTTPTADLWYKRQVIQHLPYLMATSGGVTTSRGKTASMSSLLTRLASPLDVAFYCLEWVIEWMTQHEPDAQRFLRHESDETFKTFTKIALCKFFMSHSRLQSTNHYHVLLEACRGVLSIAWRFHWQHCRHLFPMDDLDLFNFVIHPLVLNRPISLINVLGLNVMLDRYMLWLHPPTSEKAPRGLQLTFCQVLPEALVVIPKSLILLTRHVIELVFNNVLHPQLVSWSQEHLGFIPKNADFRVRLVITTSLRDQNPLVDAEIPVPLSPRRMNLISATFERHLVNRNTRFEL